MATPGSKKRGHEHVSTSSEDQPKQKKFKFTADLDVPPKAALQSEGIKFLVFVQPPGSSTGFERPVTVYIPSETKTQPGPKDDRFSVVNAKIKQPYGEDPFGPQGPPCLDPAEDPVQPTNGHYDYPPESKHFNPCTMYATVRTVLDIWERYAGHTIPWHFEQDFQRMELIPQVEWDNAQSGYGFLEFGYGRGTNGQIDRLMPYCRNFDVLAHELGHSFIFSFIGSQDGTHYGGFQESMGDIVAIISSLHFDAMVDSLLSHTAGNLFSGNELSRLGELSDSDQIRIAFNDKKMSDVANRAHEPHAFSEPLTGAIFDIIVEVFQFLLVKNGLISQSLANLSNNDDSPPSKSQLAEIQKLFTLEYKKPGNDAKFKQCLIKARDYVGYMLARAWQILGKDDEVTYIRVANAIVSADQQLNNGMFFSTIQNCFVWRQIRVRTPPRSWRQKVHH